MRLQIEPERWPELTRLLDAALDLSPAARECWLETLDPQYESLKPHLHSLLSHAAWVETRDFLDTLPKLDAHATGCELQGQIELSGVTVGPYRLIRELGAGGMGSVWLAERSDGLINRPVALKLPHGAWKRAGLVERMAREREILAALNHPHIARLYDAGIASDGQPFLAIEYVEGQPIDAYCRQHVPDVRSRLKLYLQMARAVAYAHGKLIIHRDLKPANILVTEEGHVRLLDFGIAKLLDDGRPYETELAARALTPDYASPEQITGAPLTVASDVYSLGVVLYELLTGKRPYKLKRDSRGALEDAILDVEPLKPSECAEPPLRRALRGDLDTIVLKALKKQPEDRYPTVHALVEDIERHLSSRPVLAQPDSRWYRFIRFASRHRFAVGAGVSVLLAIVAGAGVAFWQARIATYEKQRAEQVKAFVLCVFREANPYRSSGRVLNSVDLLRIATDRIDQVDRNRVDVRVELRNTLADSLLMLDDTATAESVLLQGLSEGNGALPADHKLMLEARSMLSQVYRRQSRPVQMRAVLDELLPVLRARTARYPRHLVAALLNFGNLACEMHSLEECEAAVREALAVISTRLDDREVNKVMLLTLQSLVHQQRGDRAGALASADAAVAAALEFFSEREHAIVLNARHQRATALLAVDSAAGSDEIRAVLLDTEKILGDDNRTLGLRLIDASDAAARAGLAADALQYAREGVRIVADHQAADSQIMANARLALGRALLLSTCYERSTPELAHALSVSERTFGATNPFVAKIREDLAEASTRAADERAEPLVCEESGAA